MFCFKRTGVEFYNPSTLYCFVLVGFYTISFLRRLAYGLGFRDVAVFLFKEREVDVLDLVE